ncbi:MAG: hypothetical protein IPP73_14765 [Chitinophagaceae bacterium]|nr:hypothetical protein [Chitinophagaceae bacterium]
MKRSLLFVLLLTGLNVTAQTWVKLPNSTITYSNFWATAGEDQYKIQYEYFKKDGNLLIIERFIAADFKRVLSFNPAAFDSLFSNAKILCTPEGLNDSLIKGINYKQALLLTDRQLVIGDKEIIWIMKNTGPCSSSNPCYLNIIFRKEYNKPNLIRFVKALNQYCEI